MFKLCQLENLHIELDDALLSSKANDILLIHGNNSYKKGIAYDQLSSMLSRHRVCEVNGFGLFPDLHDILRVKTVINELKIDTLIAIGGGTVIDISKSASILWQFADKQIISLLDGDVDSYLPRKLNLILIPTTTGNGAEITPFAVLYHNGNKHSVYGQCLLPNYSIYCPDLTVSLSDKQLAISIFDTLSQSIESIWSRSSTAYSKKYAEKSIELLFDNALTALESRNIDSLSCLMTASFLSGKAIAISKTTGPHALSYPLTSKFGIPHGLAVMITLPHFFLLHDLKLKMNGDQNPKFKKDLDFIKRILNCRSGEDSFEKLIHLAKSLNFDISLSSYITEKELDSLKSISFNKHRLNNHPFELSDQDIIWIFEAAFKFNG